MVSLLASRILVMPIDLIINLLQSLTGSTFLQDKLKRSEHVIRVLKQLGLDPDHPPEDFEGVYNYTLVEYGIAKPEICLQIFREREIRVLFRSVFDGNDPQGWLRSGAAFLESSAIGQKVRLANVDPIEELKAFAGAFVAVVRRSQTPKETLMGHQLQKIERTIDRRFEQLAAQVGQGSIAGGNAGGNLLALSSANCRAMALAGQMRDWFEILGYKFESYEVWTVDYFEWVIDIRVRRGRYDRILVRGIDGEAGVKDLRALAASVAGQKADEGWLVTARRISQAARGELETVDELAGFTWDELLDQDADFSGYVSWLEAEIEQRGILDRYVPLACVKEEVDSVSHQRLGMSRYGESDGWIEGYVDRWLDDPAKEHLSVLGEFGTGKTWFALHYAALALKKYTKASAAGMVRPRLPIVIPLRDYAKAVSVESLFSEFFFRKHEIPIPGYSAFEQLNRMGKLLLIFDGFDEMAARVDKQQMINNFWELAKVVVPGSKVILTCRTEHFPEAREGRSLLNAELQASTKGLTGETPQFEVLELEKFEDDQIRSVLLLQASAATVEQVIGNAQLLDLARRPVMTELILEALPDIEAGKPVDMSRVYLYAVRRKMERDIKAERTFTSMADKLYFLCELSWEMLSTDRMSINYREFPDRIRKLFGPSVQEEKDLDHWHYDMMGQTMLIRNADGDYSPAHRSLLEFFVAFKFTAELGALAPDFLELAQMKSGIDRSLEPRDYTWSEYFGGAAVSPLKGFVTESLEKLRSGFGMQVLTKAVLELLEKMIIPYHSFSDHPLTQMIDSLRGEGHGKIRFIGGNSVTLLNRLNSFVFYNKKMINLALNSADFTLANLRGSDFSYSDLRDTNFSKSSGGVFSSALTPDGKKLITGDSTGRIYVWDSQTGKALFVFKGHANAIRALLFAPKTNRLISAAADSKIRVWNLASQECIKQLEGHTNIVMSISLSEDEKRLVSGSADQTVKLWDIESEKCLKTYQGHNGWVRSVSYNSQKGMITSGGHDKTVMIWNSETGQCITTLDPHRTKINSVSLDCFGNLIASGSADGDLRIWSIETGKCLYALKGHFDSINCVYFNKSGNILISTSSDRSIKLWDVETGTCVKTLLGHHSYWLHSLSLSESEEILLTSSPQEARVWNVNTGACINNLDFRQNDINEIACHPDGNLFASTSADKSIKIWSLLSGECLRTLDGHKKMDVMCRIQQKGRIDCNCKS